MYSASPKRDRPSQKGQSQRSCRPKGKRNETAIAKKLLGPLPLSETGQRLATLFPNGWDWIYADVPKRGTKPDWETIKKYPLAPVELWSLHQDKHCIVGIRPDKGTRWGILDIDVTSPYHPQNDPDALARLRHTLEDIGIVRTLICQSSFSGGLHLYIPLPETISSYGLAVALKLHLSAAGFKLRSGQLETFPNVKRYVPQGQGFSLYNGVRLPFQPHTGFIALDTDLTPLPWNLEDWLNAFDLASVCQDLPLLKTQIADAELNHRIRKGDRIPHSLESWQERITQEKQGWSGPGETNEKLKAFACEARVFLGMDSEDQIAEYIEKTAQSTPGFYEHSNHQKDLKQRSRDVASWAMKYYWPLGGPASRETGYHGPQKSVVDFGYHQAKREAAQHRIREAIAQLQQTNALPATATARAKAIISLAKVSQHTLYKAINKPLWHPDEFPVPVKQAEIQTQQEVTQPQSKIDKNQKEKAPQPLINKGITQFLFKVGFVINNIWREALGALALKGQSATQKAITPTKIEEWGESEGGEPLISGWTELRRSLPEAFQAKIAQAEQARQRKDELEHKCRERAAKRRQLRMVDTSVEAYAQLELEIAQQFESYRSNERRTLDAERSVIVSEPVSTYEIQASAIEFDLDAIVEVQSCLVQDVEAGREPHTWEQQEFELWYGLAQAFGLVEDWHWDGLQYWVSRAEQVWPFAELSGVFTVGWLRARVLKGVS